MTTRPPSTGKTVPTETPPGKISTGRRGQAIGVERRQPARWQRELAEAVRDIDELLDLLELDRAAVGWDPGAQGEFPLRVPRPFVARMRKGDPKDPLLLQVLPRREELETPSGWDEDPLREAEVSPLDGLLHKYHGRALVVLTGACAVHCRYCFRRHFPYAEHRLDDERWQRILDYLAADPSIEEVLLSGGDPLSLGDSLLERRVDALAAIPHLRRLRLHTRQPVVLPSRVDERLTAWLTGTRLRPIVVLHTNHAREVDDSVRVAIRRLNQAGALILNQSVLLRGVNDSADALSDLSNILFDTGVLPYYLHVTDRVRGAAHFEVDEHTARRLVEDVMGRLPGYLVPRLVREIPGAPAKSPIRAGSR